MLMLRVIQLNGDAKCDVDDECEVDDECDVDEECNIKELIEVESTNDDQDNSVPDECCLKPSTGQEVLEPNEVLTTDMNH